MTYEEIHPAIRAFLGAFEGYRRLGFDRDDIYLRTGPDARTGRMACFASLQTQGMEFLFCAGAIDMPVDDFESEFHQVVGAVVSGAVSDETLDQIWEESMCHTEALSFVGAIHRKGIKIPLLPMEKAVGDA